MMLSWSIYNSQSHGNEMNNVSFVLSSVGFQMSILGQLHLAFGRRTFENWDFLSIAVVHVLF